MFEYRKTGVTQNFLRLIKKLTVEPPFRRSLVLDIENKFLSVLEVYYDNKFYGVLVCRGEINRESELVLVLRHIIAEDGLEIHLSSILAESFPEHLSRHKFNRLRLETDKSGLYELAKKFLGEPIAFTFERALNDIRARKPSLQTAFK